MPKIKVKRFKQESAYRQTDGHTRTHTDATKRIISHATRSIMKRKKLNGTGQRTVSSSQVRRDGMRWTTPQITGDIMQYLSSDVYTVSACRLLLVMRVKDEQQVCRALRHTATVAGPAPALQTHSARTRTKRSHIADFAPGGTHCATDA